VDEVRSEVDRYCAWPGQACGYKVGHSEINRLRTKAQEALGAKFDLRRFNDAVLKGGNVPMVVLARNIETLRARTSSEEHTTALQSRETLLRRLLLDQKIPTT